MFDSNVFCEGFATLRRLRRSGSRLALAASVVTLLGACSALTDVDSDLVLREDLDNAEGARTLRAGAFAAFTNAVRLSVLETGELTDELTRTDPADRSNLLDTRAVTEQETGSLGFTGRQDALEFTAQAIAAMREHVPEPGSLTGDLYARRGYTLTLLAEDFCSGVPIATFDDGRPTPAPAHTTDELFELALAAFDSAAALAGDDVQLTNLTAVERGRALLGLGRFADAGAAVASVPTDFVEQLEFSDETFFLWNSVSSAFPRRTVPDGEGGNGLPFASASADPRLDLQPAGVSGGATSMRPAKYATTATPIALADGVEARLIEAETALNAGDVAGWLDAHNALRAAEGLPPLDDPGSADARVDLHFAERAMWLFLTGHRLGDLRRLIRHYGRDAEAMFPTGLYKGGPESYGSAASLPVPEEERANPNFTGCLPDVATE